VVQSPEAESEDDVEDTESHSYDSLPTVYVSRARGNMAPFLITLYDHHIDTNSDYPNTVTHLAFDLDYDSVLNSGLIAEFYIDVNNLDTGRPYPPLERENI
jgi:hypothetical protein